MAQKVERTGTARRVPAPTPRAAARASAIHRLRRAGWLQAYLYLLPAILALGIWLYWPVVRAVELSFYQWNLLPTSPKVPVGLDNYREVVTLPEMRRALGNTALYIGGLLPFSVLLPLAIALLVNGITGRMRTLYRAVIFAPVLLAPVVVSVIWRWIMHPVQGLLNRGLNLAFGIAPINWFQDSKVALWAIILITGWKLLGFSVLIFSAGVAGIGRDYLEAASIDGATPWETVRHITLPLLSPTILFMVLLNVLLSAQWTFPLINVLTQGGPRDATTNVYYLLWQFGSRNFNIGNSAAAAVLFFAGFGVLALVFTWLSDRYSFYDN